MCAWSPHRHTPGRCRAQLCCPPHRRLRSTPTWTPASRPVTMPVRGPTVTPSVLTESVRREQHHCRVRAFGRHHGENVSGGDGPGSDSEPDHQGRTVQRPSVSSCRVTAARCFHSSGWGDPVDIGWSCGVFVQLGAGVAGFGRMYREGGIYLHRPALPGWGGTECGVCWGLSTGVCTCCGGQAGAAGASALTDSIASGERGSVVPESRPMPHSLFQSCTPPQGARASSSCVASTPPLPIRTLLTWTSRMGCMARAADCSSTRCLVERVLVLHTGLGLGWVARASGGSAGISWCRHHSAVQ
jgi:hypothetical protein